MKRGLGEEWWHLQTGCRTWTCHRSSQSLQCGSLGLQSTKQWLSDYLNCAWLDFKIGRNNSRFASGKVSSYHRWDDIILQRPLSIFCIYSVSSMAVDNAEYKASYSRHLIRLSVCSISLSNEKGSLYDRHINFQDNKIKQSNLGKL